MWGTWWVWDARLTSMLILCIFYFAYIGISNAFPRKIDGSKPAAILAIVGMVNLPIIKFSVDWWNTLHQPASIIRFDGPSINQEMLLPLIIMLLGFLFMSIFIILINIKTNLIYKKYQSEILKLG
jgi:heme exporter protein C